jgi:hypothetical protein
MTQSRLHFLGKGDAMMVSALEPPDCSRERLEVSHPEPPSRSRQQSNEFRFGSGVRKNTQSADDVRDSRIIQQAPNAQNMDRNSLLGQSLHEGLLVRPGSNNDRGARRFSPFGESGSQP